MFNVENPNVEKNHGSPQTEEYTICERNTTVEAQGQRPLALLLSPHVAVTDGGNYLSLSHALSLHTLYTTNFTNVSTHSNIIESMCPKSYL